MNSIITSVSGRGFALKIFGSVGASPEGSPIYTAVIAKEDAITLAHAIQDEYGLVAVSKGISGRLNPIYIAMEPHDEYITTGKILGVTYNYSVAQDILTRWCDKEWGQISEQALNPERMHRDKAIKECIVISTPILDMNQYEQIKLREIRKGAVAKLTDEELNVLGITREDESN